MDVYTTILGNREFFKLLYALAIVAICVVIVMRTNKLYHLSLHPGIRYFRNAFFFYGLAFFMRYFGGLVLPPSLTTALFELFIIVAGFVLLYSLVWRSVDKHKPIRVSLWNSRMSLFYIMAAVLALLDYVWNTLSLMFLSQIMLFAFIFGLSVRNYTKQKNKMFPKFYALGMALLLIAWGLNFLAATWLHWNPVALINIYLLNILFFLVILGGVLTFTRGNHGKKTRTP